MNVEEKIERIRGDELAGLQKKANRRGSNKGLMKVTDAEFYDLYTRGYNDKKIAGLVGVSQTAIWKRRMIFNLSPNGEVGNKKAEITDFEGKINELRKKTVEYNLQWRKKPETKKSRKAYLKKYYQRPVVKKKVKEYQQRPEAKQKTKEYNQRPEVKERLKEYRKRIEVKKKREIYNKAYYIKHSGK